MNPKTMESGINKAVIMLGNIFVSQRFVMHHTFFVHSTFCLLPTDCYIRRLCHGRKKWNIPLKSTCFSQVLLSSPSKVFEYKRSNRSATWEN
jgi:hypothetical protein